MYTFEFPVGYHEMNPTKIIDYQLNRWYSFGYIPLEDMQEAGRNIKKLDDWKAEFVRQAEKALNEGRLMNGTFHYRAAEFHTQPKDPDKLALYDKFIDQFYNELFVNEPIERHHVPYENGKTLPATRVLPQTEITRGTIVVHGGFDSFIEELYSLATVFARQGYEVILFDGPGQGGALKYQDLPMTLEWEKPVGAVLDYFERDDVTLLGISMGGWLCFRAAAFEPRVKRVIASSIAFDYMQIPPKPVADFARWLLKHERLFEVLTDVKIKLRPQEKWGIENLMYIWKIDNPKDASLAMIQLNEENQHPDLVTQDVIILSGSEDHFIPLKLHHLQVAALKNVHSMTERIFTPETQAQNHCQVGNFGLAIDTMVNWLAEKQPEPQLA